MSNKIITFEGPNAMEMIGNELAKSTEPFMGIAASMLPEWHILYAQDKNGDLIETSYIKAMLHAGGDKFVFPGNDESIAMAQNTLVKFPFLEDKVQARWVDSAKMKSQMDLFVFDDKTIFYERLDKNNIFGYMIVSQKVADTFKSLVNFLWNNANPIN